MSTDPTTIFIHHIQKHISRYYHSFASEQTCVHLVDKQVRRTAVLYRFKVSNNGQTRSIFVKVPFRGSPNGQTNGNAYEKPLLYPKADANDMHRLHYSALRAIYEYFTVLNQKSLGAIRVLDYLPEYHAILTEDSSDLKLRQLLFRKNRLYSVFPGYELRPAFQNVGTWLNVYHKMPKEEDVKVRHSRREDYVEAIIKLKDFLTKTLGDETFFQKTSSLIINTAQDILPESLPRGLGHGNLPCGTFL